MPITKPYRRPPLKPYQVAAFFHLLRYAWIEGSTKCGKTHTGIVWLFEQALFGKFKNYWWVAPTYKTARIAYTRMRDAIPKYLRVANETEMTLRLPNGHIVWFLSAEKPDNLYGEDVGAVVIDEASRMREEAWFAIRSTVTFTRGLVRGIGNVKGRKNWFFKLCRLAEAALASDTPHRDSHWAKITAADAVREGILPQAEIDDAQRILPEAVFQELYYGVPSADGSNPFGLAHIAACVKPALDVDVLVCSAAAPAAVGRDFARAVDWFVNLGLDRTGAVCRFSRFQKDWEAAYKAVYEEVDGHRAPSLCDSTGLGDVVLDRLQTDRPRRFEGYKFTSESKQKLMEGLAVAIQHGEVSFPDGPIRAELEQFEYTYTRTGVRYSAPEGFHDDCVMALALAVELLKRQARRQVRRIYPTWSDAHELAAFPAYHQDAWDRGTVRLLHVAKPQIRRPWALIWFVAFPNADVVAVMESPATDFNVARGDGLDVETYRAVVLDMETALGRKADERRIDLEHYPPPEGTASPLAVALGRACPACAAKAPAPCPHRLTYKPVVADPTGYTLVAAALGAPGAAARPKLYALKDYTPNFCAAKRAFAYVEQDAADAQGDRRDYVDKDFNDLDLAIYNTKMNVWRATATPAKLIPKRAR